MQIFKIIIMLKNLFYLFLSLFYYCSISLILLALLETSGLQMWTIQYLCALILLTQNYVVINLINLKFYTPTHIIFTILSFTNAVTTQPCSPENASFYNINLPGSIGV